MVAVAVGAAANRGPPAIASQAGPPTHSQEMIGRKTPSIIAMNEGSGTGS